MRASSPQAEGRKPSSATSASKKKSRRTFWFVVVVVVLGCCGAFLYARHRIAKEQERQDLITDQFVYDDDEETGVKRLVPRHEDWQERIKQINEQ